jgi:alpha/beta superfamily hydrolase
MQKLYRNEQKIFIPGPSGRLEAQVAGILPNLGSETVIPSEESQIPRDATTKTVGIICHPHPLYQGSMHNKVVTTLVRAWQALGLATIRFNFRGVGESEGQYGDAIGEVEDLKAIIQWLIEQKAENRQSNIQDASIELKDKGDKDNDNQQKAKAFKLYLGGFSFGSSISAKVAADMGAEISLLLSIAPVVNHFQLLENQLPTCPWLVIQGINDELTHVATVQQWFDNIHKNHLNNISKLIMIPGATHFFHDNSSHLRKLYDES